MRLLINLLVVAVLFFFTTIATAQIGGCTLIKLSVDKDTVSIGEDYMLRVSAGSPGATSTVPFLIDPPARYDYVLTVGNDAPIRGATFSSAIVLHLGFGIKLQGGASPGMKKIQLTMTAPGVRITPPNCNESEPSIGTTFVYVLPPPPAAPTTAGGFTGLWWNPNTDGQGVFFTQNSPSNIAFIGWFTYDANGVAKWYVGDRCAIGSGTVCSTTLYEAANGKFDGINFNNAQLKRSAVGEAIFSFTSSQAGEMIYNLQGVKGSLPLVRQPF